MKKTMLLLLAGIFLLTAAAAHAEYDRYRLTAGDMLYAFDWRVCPLDAHNTVVTACSYGGKPWHITWYRDGEKYRDQAWLVEDPYLEGGIVPEPAVWDGEHLTVTFSERKGAFRTVILDGMVSPDPDNYETYIAEWTENGLENRREPPENRWYIQAAGRLAIRFGDGQLRLFKGETEIPLPEAFRTLPREKIVSLECFPWGEESCLLAYLDYQEKLMDRHYHVVCSDHGKERYDVTLADEDEWDVMPDGKGGFLIRNGWPEGNYEPVRMTHYTADGEPDRKLELKGNEVVIRTGPSATDADGNFILYGSAVAESRKVYSVFRMTMDGEMNLRGLDVRDIDPDYGAYMPGIYAAPDGTAWVLIFRPEAERGPRPVLIPFDLLEKSGDDRGLTLQ